NKARRSHRVANLHVSRFAHHVSRITFNVSPTRHGFTGLWGGMVVCAKGISSSEWRRLPAGSIIVGVTKMRRFFLMLCDDSLRKRRPASGKSPSSGTLSLVLVTFSEM